MQARARTASHTGIIIAPTLDYMDRAFTDARAVRLVEGADRRDADPELDVDDSLAPPGQHVASLFCQQFAPELPDGRSWDDAREAAADLIIDTVEQYAPNFKRSVHRAADPLAARPRAQVRADRRRHHARASEPRPALGGAPGARPRRLPRADRGLYMCGAGTHPGGGVTGAPGHNAAHEILRDSRKWRRAA